MKGVKLPVWIMEDHFAVVAQLTNGSEVIFTSTAKFETKKAKSDAIKAVQEAMDDLHIEGIALSTEQKEYYYKKD